MSCCPYAACTYAAPLIVAAPTLVARLRAQSPARKAALLAALPIVGLALWYALRPEEALKFAEGVGRCKEAQYTLSAGAFAYAYVVYQTATAPPVAVDAEPRKPPAACPFSGKGGDASACPASGKVVG